MSEADYSINSIQEAIISCRTKLIQIGIDEQEHKDDSDWLKGLFFERAGVEEELRELEQKYSEALEQI